MTDEELDSLESVLIKLADDMERYATDDWDEHENVMNGVSAIRALRAQLAEAQVDLTFMTENRSKWQDSATQRWFRIEEANARADRAEAERAAQIEVDAALVQEYEARLAKWEMQNGTHMSPYEALAEATAAIRTQPHDRTALDRMLAEAESRGYQLASDEAKRSGWHLRRYDLAKRDAELATP